jgi:hypothetical protein
MIEHNPTRNIKPDQTKVNNIIRLGKIYLINNKGHFAVHSYHIQCVRCIVRIGYPDIHINELL